MQATRPTPGQAPSTDPSAALAKQLGVPAAKVKSALADVMPAGGPPSGTPPSGAPGTATTATPTTS